MYVMYVCIYITYWSPPCASARERVGKRERVRERERESERERERKRERERERARARARARERETAKVCVTRSACFWWYWLYMCVMYNLTLDPKPVKTSTVHTPVAIEPSHAIYNTWKRERVVYMFIGTQFSNLYTSVYPPTTKYNLHTPRHI